MNLSAHYLKANKKNPWDRKLVVSTVSKRKNKKVVNENFKEMSEMEENKFWKRVFKEASVNKFYPGYSFKNGILIYKNGNQIKELLLSNSYEMDIEVCKEFFNKNTGMMSPADREKEKNKEQKRVRIEEIKWDKVKKHDQITYIHDYVERKGNEMGFNEQQKNNFYEFIQYHLILKNLKAIHFEYENFQLKNITNIIYDEEGKYWKIEKSPKPKKEVSKKEPDEGKGEKYWSVKQPSSNLDVYFHKQIELICKPKASNFKFIPSSSC